MSCPVWILIGYLRTKHIKPEGTKVKLFLVRHQLWDLLDNWGQHPQNCWKSRFLELIVPDFSLVVSEATSETSRLIQVLHLRLDKFIMRWLSNYLQAHRTWKHIGNVQHVYWTLHLYHKDDGVLKHMIWGRSESSGGLKAPRAKSRDGLAFVFQVTDLVIFTVWYVDPNLCRLALPNSGGRTDVMQQHREQRRQNTIGVYILNQSFAVMSFPFMSLAQRSEEEVDPSIFRTLLQHKSNLSTTKAPMQTPPFCMLGCLQSNSEH